MFRKAIVVTVAMFASTSASAQQYDWKLTPYLWAAAIDGSTSVGPLRGSVSMSFGEVLDILRGGGLVRIEAEGDRNGFYGDLVYLRLKEEEARDTIGGSLEVKLDSFIAEGAFFHKLNEQYALELGVRYWDFETTLRPALLPEASRSSDFVDGLIGFRSRFEVDENWDILFRANVGGGGSEFSAGLQVDFRRHYKNGNSLDIGFRALDIDYENGSGLTEVGLDLSLTGLSIGYTFDL